jgi:hypothetical protein
MTEVATTTLNDRPKRRNGAARDPLVSASALAVHLGCSRPYIAKLVAEGVIEKRGGGYYQDQCRLRYLTHLRRENRRSPRSEADTAHIAVKTEMLQLRLMEEKRDLVRMDEVNEMLDSMMGLVLTKLGGLPARVGGTDLVARRRAEAVVFAIRTELADEFQRRADERGEPDE